MRRNILETKNLYMVIDQLSISDKETILQDFLEFLESLEELFVIYMTGSIVQLHTGMLFVCEGLSGLIFKQ